MAKSDRHPSAHTQEKNLAEKNESPRNQPDRNKNRLEGNLDLIEKRSRDLMRSTSREMTGNMDNFMAPFFDMQRQMNRMMEGMFTSMTDMWSVQADKMMPKVRVWEDSGSFHLKTRLPQNNPDNIEVAINDNILTLRWHEDQQQNNGAHQFSSSHDAYRTVIIPDNADPDKAEAVCENGSLEIIVPKKQDADENARSIPIRRSARQ